MIVSLELGASGLSRAIFSYKAARPRLAELLESSRVKKKITKVPKVCLVSKNNLSFIQSVLSLKGKPFGLSH